MLPVAILAIILRGKGNPFNTRWLSGRKKQISFRNWPKLWIKWIVCANLALFRQAI